MFIRKILSAIYLPLSKNKKTKKQKNRGTEIPCPEDIMLYSIIAALLL
jgi:hypothetical protein